MRAFIGILKRGLFLSIFTVLLVACKKDNNNPEGPIQSTDPVITETGTPVGAKTSATIGASGGTLSSADGELTLKIPAGALTSETEVSILPITNNAPLGVGFGYRLEPEGTHFNTPVQMVFNYKLLDGTLPDLLWIVTQAADGSWNAALKSVVDKNAGTVTVEANHFSDWALGKFIDFVLEPSSRKIQKGQSVQLKLTGFMPKQTADEEDLAPLIPISELGNDLAPLTPIPPVESRLMDFRVKQWTLNGANAPVSNSNGSLTASGLTATYTAPNSKPSVNPVAITVQLESRTTGGKTGSYFVTSNITVIESDYFLFIEIDGTNYEFYQYGFDGIIVPDPNNYTQVVCGSSNSVLEIAANRIVNSTTIKESFELKFTNAGVTTRNLIGGNDDINFMSDPKFDYTFGYEERTYDAINQHCNTESRYNNISVTILTYDTTTGELQGNLTGEVHSYSTTDDINNCKTSERHTINAEFRLIISDFYFGN